MKTRTDRLEAVPKSLRPPQMTVGSPQLLREPFRSLSAAVRMTAMQVVHAKAAMRLLGQSGRSANG